MSLFLPGACSTVVRAATVLAFRSRRTSRSPWSTAAMTPQPSYLPFPLLRACPSVSALDWRLHSAPPRLRGFRAAVATPHPAGAGPSPRASEPAPRSHTGPAVSPAPPLLRCPSREPAPSQWPCPPMPQRRPFRAISLPATPLSAPGHRVRPCLAVLLGQRRCSLLSRACTRAVVPPSLAARVKGPNG